MTWLTNDLDVLVVFGGIAEMMVIFMAGTVGAMSALAVRAGQHFWTGDSPNADQPINSSTRLFCIAISGQLMICLSHAVN